MNYLNKVSEVEHLLSDANELLFVKQIKNAKLMGGTGGEVLAIICSLLKTYEMQLNPAFELIKKQAYELYEYAESVGLYPKANFSILEELSR